MVARVIGTVDLLVVGLLVLNPHMLNPHLLSLHMPGLLGVGLARARPRGMGRAVRGGEPGPRAGPRLTAGRQQVPLTAPEIPVHMKASVTQVPSVRRFHRLVVPQRPECEVPLREQDTLTVAPSPTVPATA